MTLIPQPLYSPDLAPVDLGLFTKLKFVLKGQQLASVKIKGNLLAELCSIPKEAFQEFLKMKKCWEQCIESGGEYFRGDKTE
jgi:hypothetical protein